MKGLEKYKVNYNTVVKSFFDSVITRLSACRLNCDTGEEKNIDNALLCLGDIVKDPQKYFTENNFIKENLVGVSALRDKSGHHDMVLYVAIMNVLTCLGHYYKIPTSRCYADALEQSLKDYFVLSAPTLVRRTQYKIVSPRRLLFNLANQNTK
ncbi:MAG: hypothetical protein J5679_00860 [Alphaproteobacteria bacterium]|nr:hypothetical protein [Alphaproteobacteria bacterium]